MSVVTKPQNLTYSCNTAASVW